jgi:hypothetical protein
VLLQAPNEHEDGWYGPCLCVYGPVFRRHELQPHIEEIHAGLEAGSERVGRCKHGDAVAVEDRTTDDREADQQGFEAFDGAREDS